MTQEIDIQYYGRQNLNFSSKGPDLVMAKWPSKFQTNLWIQSPANK